MHSPYRFGTWRHFLYSEGGFWQLALKWAIPALVSYFGSRAGSKGGGGGDSEPGGTQPLKDLLQGSASDLRQEAGGMKQLGAGNISDASSYLRQLLSGNPQGLLAATAPERGRVIDQYDTARQAIGQFGPRGGGTTSAMAQSRLDESQALSDIFSTSRREAFGQSAALGQGLMGLGLSADQLASADLEKVMDAILTEQGFDVQKRAQNMQLWASLGQSAGYAAGSAWGD